MDYEKWKPLYIAKLKAIYKHADFTDSKKDLEYKDQKKETLIEIIDILDEPVSVPYLFNNEQLLKEAVKFIETNIFRAFTNKCNYLPHLTL